MSRFDGNEKTGRTPEKTESVAFNRLFSESILITLALWLASTFPASAAEQRKMVDGMEIYYGVVPAEVISNQSATHDPKMHRGQTGSHHLVVALFDAKTGQRISDATVDATVTPLGLAATGKRLEPMLINQTTTYGNFFDFPSGSGPFHITLNITRPNLPLHSVAKFEYWPANQP